MKRQSTCAAQTPREATSVHVMSLASLDRLLFGDDRAPNVSDVIEVIAAEQLWPGLRDSNDVATYLRGVAGETANLVAASLLILLHRDASVLDDVPWRPRAADLLSTRLNQLQPHASQPQEKGSHAVFTVCAGVVVSVEADFRAQSLNFNDLKQTPALRNSILRRLNGGAGAVLVRPFVPRAAVDASLARLFDAAETMSTSEDADPDAAYAGLAEALQACEATVASLDTHFARATVGLVASALSAVATRRIELSRPPARIVAIVDSRPLPLREPGVTCDVALHLENASDVGATHVTALLSAEDAQVTTPSDPVLIETLRPRTAMPIAMPVTVLRGATDLKLDIRVAWRNPDHSLGSEDFQVTVLAQPAGIDWDSVVGLQPFAPYPVENAMALVGRGQLLKQLELQFASIPLGNMYVTGQRRVGKTSLVRVLTQQLKQINAHLLVASVEMGEVRQEGGKDTISELGVALARKLIEAANASGAVDPPRFNGSLAPLNELVDELRQLDDRLTFLLVIDEFDELPDEMFRRSGPGDAMFLPMRSLAQKPYVGWILVGGERMPYIRDEQATRLNTFKETKVDYLAFVEQGARSDARTGNFASLVRQPLPNGFEVTDEAIAEIHATTLGNPHFSKALCAHLYDDAVRRKDALMQQQDVARAIKIVAAQSDVELFAHFWEDGIFSNDREERRRVELERRHVLAAVADARRAGHSESERVDTTAETLGLSRATAVRTRKDFLRRGVLADTGGLIAPKVPLFGSWLEDEGAYQLAPKGIAERAEGEFKGADQAATVNPSEISLLLRQWGAFKFRGESISRDDIARWLEQFANPVEARLMFRLLERFRTIAEAELLEGLRRLNRLISHEGRISLEKGQRTLAHVLVAGVGESGASGQAIAYKYRQANNLRQRNVVSVDAIEPRLATDQAIRAVVLVDDFIGSGKTVAKDLDRIRRPKGSDVQFFVFAISGIPEALIELEQSTSATALDLSVEVAHPLTSSELPFAADSPVFKNETDQTKAEEILRRYGSKLVPSMPMGFGQRAALVAFPDNCPNNVPPIFWSDANDWRPLFRRTGR